MARGANGSVHHQQPPHQTLQTGQVFSQIPDPVFTQASLASTVSSAAQPHQQPQAFTTGPAPADRSSGPSNWNYNPQTTSEKGYISPLINLYLDRDSKIEAVSDSHSNWVLVSYDDLQEAPFGSDADPTDTESAHPEDQSYREGL